MPCSISSILRASVTGAIVLVVTSCMWLEPHSAHATSCAVPVAAEYADIEAAVHQLVNRRRTAARLPVLAFDGMISEVARQHSRAMAAGDVPIGHDRFNERIAAVGRCFAVRAAYENVTVLPWNHSMVALMAVEEWLDSPPHRATIFSELDLSGVGVIRGSTGRYYVTQMYVLAP